MWVVLCSAQDVPGLWAFQGLQLRGLRPIELVTAEMLPYSLKWEHTLGASDPSISITLAMVALSTTALCEGFLIG